MDPVPVINMYAGFMSPAPSAVTLAAGDAIHVGVGGACSVRALWCRGGKASEGTRRSFGLWRKAKDGLLILSMCRNKTFRMFGVRSLLFILNV